MDKFKTTHDFLPHNNNDVIVS